MAGLVFGESSLVAAGFGYEINKEGKEKYNKVKSMHIRAYMLATDIASLTNNWNV